MSVRGTGARMAELVRIEQLEAEVERLRAKEGQRPRWREGMSDIVAQLGARAAVWDNLNGMLDREAIDEIERLRADKTAISQTASDYLHDIERLRAALKPFVRLAEVGKLSLVIQEDIDEARRALAHSFDGEKE